MYLDVLSSIVHNCHKLETTQSTSAEKRKYTWYSHTVNTALRNIYNYTWEIYCIFTQYIFTLYNKNHLQLHATWLDVSPTPLFKKILSERSQTQTEYTYDSICIKFKNGQNFSVRIEDHGYTGLGGHSHWKGRFLESQYWFLN